MISWNQIHTPKHLEFIISMQNKFIGKVARYWKKYSQNKFTDKYKYCNHHEISEKHKLVEFGGEKFVANNEAIPLLKALNEIGLRTRSHHIDETENAWVCILLDNVELEINVVNEIHAERTHHNGKKELLIRWKK